MGRRGPIPAAGSGGGGSAPTGTGFTHNTGGVQDGASTALTFTGDTTGTGTAASIALTTVKVNNATVPAAGALTTGNVLQVTGASALSYAAVNLAGGAAFVTGSLPAANLPTTADLAANGLVKGASGTGGVFTVSCVEVDNTGDAKCTPKTIIGHSALAGGAGISTAYTSPSNTSGTWKVNIAVVADANDNVNGGAWDISFVFKHTGASTAAIVGTAPGSVAPDNGSAGTSAWRATVDVVADTFRLRVTPDASLATDVGYVVQIIPVIQ